jgi:hypothetical protein
MSALLRGREVRPLAGLGGAMAYSTVQHSVPTRSSGQAGGVTNRAFTLPIMSDGDDSAALWKVNRTIHELVKDRVQQGLP